MEINEGKRSKRGRSMTSISLSWIAKKVRRANNIKKSLDSGAYQIDPEMVAKAMLSQEPKRE